MDLIRFIKQSPHSRKIFGQREIKIIEKQLNGINLTQSEKNRLSRDIRKKLEFIREASRFEEEFALKKGSLVKEKIEETKRIILENQPKNKIKKIILFGSVLKNEITPRSDIDIAIEFEKISEKDAQEFRKKISGLVSEKVDIQVFNVLPDKVKASLLNNHKIIYKDE